MHVLSISNRENERRTFCEDQTISFVVIIDATLMNKYLYRSRCIGSICLRLITINTRKDDRRRRKKDRLIYSRIAQEKKKKKKKKHHIAKKND